MLLDERGLLRLGHERKFDARIIEQRLAEFPVFQRKKVFQIL